MSESKPYRSGYEPDEDLDAAVKRYKDQRNIQRAMQNSEAYRQQVSAPINPAPDWVGDEPDKDHLPLTHSYKKAMAGAFAGIAEPLPVLAESEFVVFAESSPHDILEEPCRDAAAMQKAVAVLKTKPGVTRIGVFKRMVIMEAKVEWENAGCDL